MTCSILDLGKLNIDPVASSVLQIDAKAELRDLDIDPIGALGTLCLNVLTPTDPILALLPIWAFTGLESILGLQHLDPVPLLIDLANGNDALQSEGPAREPVFFDATAQGGRGGIWAADQNVQHWLQTAFGVELGESWTIVAEMHNRHSNNFTGWFSIRPTWDGNSEIELYSTEAAHSSKNVVRNRSSSAGVLTIAETTSGDAGDFNRVDVVVVPGLDSTPDRGVNYSPYGKSVFAVSSGTTPFTSQPVFVGRGYSSTSSNLNGWIMSLYLFDRWIQDPGELDIIRDTIDARNPDYYRDAVPQAWSHFRFREVLNDLVAVDAAGGIPAGGDLVNGTIPRAPIGGDASPMGYTFDGVNDSVNFTLGDFAWMFDLVTDFTIDIWQKNATFTGVLRALIGNTVGGANPGLHIGLDDRSGLGAPDGIQFFWSPSSSISVVGVMEQEPDAPQHVVLTCSKSGGSGTFRLYVDESEVGSTVVALNGLVPTKIMQLGAAEGGFFFKGQLSEPNFHKVALTVEEIEARGRVYRGDLGQRILDGIPDFAHLFMLEEKAGAIESVDRITGKYAPLQGGPLTGVYSPVRGTLRRYSFDGANDGLNFPAVDVDVNIQNDDWTLFLLMSRTAVGTKNIMGLLHSVPAPDGGLYMGTTGVNIFARLTGDDGVVTSNAFYSDNDGNVNLYAVRHSAANKTIQSVIVKTNSATVWQGALIDTTPVGNYDYPSDMELGKSDGQPYGPILGKLSTFGLVKGVLTDNQLLWIHDISRWT